MTAEAQEEVVRRYAKYIFLDVVKFSQRSAEAQSAIVKALNDIIVSALTHHGVSNENRILIPTGDGTCIALIGTALPYDAHIQIALAILEKLHAYNKRTTDPSRQFGVRIGINQNTDILVTDINDKPNIAGAGINVASRIMEKSGANQILASQTVYDELQPSERYMNKFRAFDAHSKHGLKLRIFQYISAGHVGLNREALIDLKETTAVPLKLSELAAYYFAHAIKHRPFILSKQGPGQKNYSLATMLWFLAKESVAESEATEINPYQPGIYGEGKASLEELFNHYNDLDMDVIMELACLIRREFDGHDRFWEGGTGIVPLFVNEDGAVKLKREWPKIWESFELDKTNE